MANPPPHDPVQSGPQRTHGEAVFAKRTKCLKLHMTLASRWPSCQAAVRLPRRAGGCDTRGVANQDSMAGRSRFPSIRHWLALLPGAATALLLVAAPARAEDATPAAPTESIAHPARTTFACRDPLAETGLQGLGAKPDPAWRARLAQTGDCYEATPDQSWTLLRRAGDLAQMRFVPADGAAGVEAWFSAADLVDADGHSLAAADPTPLTANPTAAAASDTAPDSFGHWLGINEQRTQAFHAERGFTLHWRSAGGLLITLFRAGEAKGREVVRARTGGDGASAAIAPGDYVLLIDGDQGWSVTAQPESGSPLQASGGTGGFAATPIDLARPQDTMPKPHLASLWPALLAGAAVVLVILLILRRNEPNWRTKGDDNW